MKLRKRIAALVLAAVTMLAAMPITTPAYADDAERTADMTWTTGHNITEAMTITGGTAEDPVKITVNGAMQVQATVTIASGYVEIVSADSSSNYAAASGCTMFSVSDGATLTVNNVKLRGYTGYPIITNSGTVNLKSGAYLDGYSCAATAGIENGNVTLDNATIDYCKVGISGASSISLADSTIKNCTTGILQGAGCSCSYSVSGKVQISGNETNVNFNNNSSTFSVVGSLTDGSNITITNAGSACLAKSGGSYTMKESDAAFFAYKLSTAERTTGGAVSSSVYYDNGAVYLKRGYKSHITYTPAIEGCTVTLKTVNGADAAASATESDGYGKYLIVYDGDSLTWQLALKDGYGLTGSLPVVTVNGAAVTVTANTDGSYSYSFAQTVSGPTTIAVSGVEAMSISPYKVEVTGASLTLDGPIILNFVVSTQNDIDADVVFTCNGVETHQDHYLSSSSSPLTLTFELTAKQLKDTVNLRIYDENNKLVCTVVNNVVGYTGVNYTVQDYINKAATSGSDNLKALTSALSDFGSLAQSYFNYKTDSCEPLKNQTALEAVTAETLEDYMYSEEGSLPAGITMVGSSLLLNSDTSIRHYFTIDADHSPDDYTFVFDSETVTPVQSGEYYYVQKDNIAAKDLDTAYTLTITGKNAAGATVTYTLNYSALSYVQAALSYDGSSENLRPLVKSLYLYNQAANSYFG